MTLALLLLISFVQPHRAAPAAKIDALPLQVSLDRAGFSPGVIDGRPGANTNKALAAFKAQSGSAAPPQVEGTMKYRVTAEDAAGPYLPSIPTDLVEQSKLKALSYTSVAEALAERFHCTPALLQQLNPGATFAAGDEITVPNVEPFVVPVSVSPTTGSNAPKAAPGNNVTVTVTKSTSALTVEDASGKVVFYAPVTTGSEHDPLPIGEWKVTVVQFNPPFRYNPALFWDAEPSHTKATIPAGPNGPVGVVWIDLSKEHYGLHGTSEPATIGRTQSHGCVRLTNWDAMRVAGMVKPGTRVVFKP